MRKIYLDCSNNDAVSSLFILLTASRVAFFELCRVCYLVVYVGHLILHLALACMSPDLLVACEGIEGSLPFIYHGHNHLGEGGCHQVLYLKCAHNTLVSPWWLIIHQNMWSCSNRRYIPVWILNDPHCYCLFYYRNGCSWRRYRRRYSKLYWWKCAKQ